MSWKGQRKSYSGIFGKRPEKCGKISEKEQKMAGNGRKNIGECQTTEMNVGFG